MRVLFTKKSLLYFFFSCFSLSLIFFNSNLSGFVFLFFSFFFLGFCITLFSDVKNFFEVLTFSSIISLSLSSFLIFFFNIILKIPFSKIYFFFFSVLILGILYFNKKENFEIVFEDKFAFLTLFFYLIILSVIFIKIKYLLGSDVARFTSVSKIFFYEKNFVTNLASFDLAKDFFYPPAVFSLTIIPQFFGLNPVISFTLLGFFCAFIIGVASHVFFRKFFKKDSKNVLLFFLFFFNFPLLFILFALAPFGFAFLFLIGFFIGLLKHDEKSFSGLLFFSILGIFMFHWQMFFFAFTFFISFLIILIKEKKVFEIIQINKKLIFHFLLAILMVLPYVFFFRNGFVSIFSQRNVVDLSSFALENVFDFKRNNLVGVFSQLLLSTHIGIRTFFFKTMAVLSLFFVFKKVFSNQTGRIVFVFFILSTSSLFFATNQINFSRFYSNNFFPYSIFLGSFLTNYYLNIILILFFYSNTGSLLELSLLFFDQDFTHSIKVLPPSFLSMIEHIKQNTFEDSKIFFDGGGEGCLGGSNSMGEFIFPLTGRNYLFFTNYCWANYSIKEYESYVDFYNGLSIDPNSDFSIKSLEKFSIDYVFIGGNDVGLSRELFLSSKNYEVVFNEDESFLFKIK